jgi:transketolase
VNDDGPTGLLLSRQDLPILEGTADRADDVARGAYVLDHGGDDPDLVLIGTGSEVHVCLGAAERLRSEGIVARVVSMPSWDLFELQDEGYQESVLPSDVPTLAVEAATSFGWDRWADDSVSIDRFGASAPGKVALANLGFTPENVAERAKQLLAALEDGD